MANPKEVKGKGETKSASGRGLGAEIFDSIFDQAVDEYIRPIVDKLPAEVIKALKAAGANKWLPFLSMGLNTWAKKNFSWGDKFTDVMTEMTSELRRRINELDGKGEPTAPTEPVTKGAAKTAEYSIASLLLHPRLKSKCKKFAQALAETFKGKTDDEVRQINALLASLDADNMLLFLDMNKADRTDFLKAFVKRGPKETEVPFEERIREAKKELGTLWKSARKHVVEPVIEPLDKLAGRADRPVRAFINDRKRYHRIRDRRANTRIGRVRNLLW